MIYVWKNQKGETVETDNPVDPPTPGTWERVYIFGLGKVGGAGGSPARMSTKQAKGT